MLISGIAISKDVFVCALDMVVDLIEIFSDLGESSVLGNLQLDGYLHIDLGVNADLDLSFYFHNSSS